MSRGKWFGSLIVLACLAGVGAMAVMAEKPAAVHAENSKVTPGLVRWHRDFATACEASKKSGKPVFLFHLLGSLDDRFC